jgi:hypothetical protein
MILEFVDENSTEAGEEIKLVGRKLRNKVLTNNMLHAIWLQ